MPPRTKYREGYIDTHVRIPTDKRNAYDKILAEEEKTIADDYNEFVTHRIEQKCIEQNPVPQKQVIKNISCLGYTPKPVHEVQQKIDAIKKVENPLGIPILSNDQEIRSYLKSLNIRSANELKGKLSVWNTQLKYTLTDLVQALAYANNQRRLTR